MKKLFVSIFAAALMLLGTRAQAQVVPGAGYLFSSEKASSEKETTPFHGFYFGASYNFHLVGGLGVAFFSTVFETLPLRIWLSAF